ncbi:MAG: aminotransferase class I/II-fold pyridoxal phosphate-dependent enzyme [Nanoarchaeota archaeon]|nr:aminotransferase class I/II-fold pyridoxal phosphate-dependent enzyme [Nanoarchaeota archaeon]
MKIRDFKLERFFAKYEFAAPYLLCSSDCEAMDIKELLEISGVSDNDLKKVWLGYTETLGDKELKKEISKLYVSTKPESIMTLAGAEEGIFIFMNTVLSRGDDVIVQMPGYQSLYEIAESIGAKVIPWKMSHKENWELDIDFLNKNITEKTKAIVINTPHNPTGYQIPIEKYKDIVNIAKKNGLFLFSDEVYRGLEYDAADRLAAACDIYDKAISLGVMSKTYGLAGLRIGWVGTKDAGLLSRMASFKDYTSICNSAPSEYLATIALKNKDKIVKRNLAIIDKNFKLLDRFFDKYSDIFTWIRPKAGSIGFAEIKSNMDSQKFCIDLTNKKGVLLLPGSMYDYGHRHFRLGFGRKNMAEALRRLGEYVDENLS